LTDPRERSANAVSEPAERVAALLRQAKTLAQEYRALTGKPLGITGEIAEYEAARLLGLTLTAARQAGYDAIAPATGKRYQIKGRCIRAGQQTPGQRMGTIDTKKEFDAVLLVLLNDSFEATAIYEANRYQVLDALAVPGSKARNERGALAVTKFKSMGRQVWPVPAAAPRDSGNCT